MIRKVRHANFTNSPAIRTPDPLREEAEGLRERWPRSAAWSLPSLSRQGRKGFTLEL